MADQDGEKYIYCSYSFVYNIPMQIKTCEYCSNFFTQNSKNIGRFCSRKCYWSHRKNHIEEYSFRKGKKPWNKGLKGYNSGKFHWNWRGGRRKHPSGYIEIYCPEHPFARHGGYIYEHRLVMEKKIGRFIPSNEHVHHINGVKDDNRIENLMLFSSNSEHRKYHAWLKKQIKS